MNAEQIPIANLTIWRHPIRGAEHAVLPASTSRPNPIALPSFVVASVFAPGTIYAVDRETGIPRWHVPTSSLAASNVTYADQMLYGMTGQTLLAIDPATGHVQWSFCPYGTSHEWMYSSPTIRDGRLFIGDRAGRFHCLSTRTGMWIWWRQISRAKNLDVNATAVAWGELAIVATNGGSAIGLEAVTGRPVWRTRLDGPSISELSVFQNEVLVRTTRSVYLLRPSNGEVIHRWNWRGKEVRFVVNAEKKIFVLLDNLQNRGNKRAGDPNQSARLICLRRDRTIFDQPISGFATGLRWDRQTKELYESRIDGFGIIDGRSGMRKYEIKARDRVFHPGIVDVRDGIIYLLSMKGVMYALRHP